MDSNSSIRHIEQTKSEEVAAIIDKMPNRFGLAISLIVIGLFSLLFLFGWLIKYPNVKKGPITISTRQAPVKLTSNNTGVLQLIHKTSGNTVKENEYLAIIKNPADTRDIKKIDSLLKRFDFNSLSYESHRNFFPNSVILGELSNKYFYFLKAFYQYLDYYHDKPYLKQKDILQNLSSSQKKTLEESLQEYDRLKNKYHLMQSLFKKDSILFSEALIQETEYEKTKIALITSEQEFKLRQKEIISDNFQILDADNKIKLLGVQKNEKERELELQLINSYYDLQENIEQWEKTYVFKSPINGKVEFLNFSKDNDYIQQGQELFSILPEQNEMIGQCYLPSQGAGEVKKGQKVIIKLDDYPYTQFGSVQGEVINISQLTNQQSLSMNNNKINSYLVTIKLPKGLVTNYGSSLSFHFEAKGIAEIITDDKRLIQRLFDNLKYRLK